MFLKWLSRHIILVQSDVTIWPETNVARTHTCTRNYKKPNMHPLATNSELNYSNLTIVILQWSVRLFLFPVYKRLPLFVSCLLSHNNSLSQPTYICLPNLSYLNIPHATSLVLTNCSTLISLVFVPCPLSLPIYKITIYIDIEREPSKEYKFCSIASPHFNTKVKYSPPIIK